MAIDFVQNIAGFGDAADRLLQNNGDPGVLRPYLGHDGKSYMTKMVRNERTGVIEPKVFVTNTPATLSYDAWKQFDAAVIDTIYDRLRAFADIRAAGLVYNLPNGMAHTVLQYQTMGDITGATVSMDPSRRSETDRPESDLALFPLPIIHKDFDISARELLTSRQGIMPLDTTNARLAARKVAEELEDMTIGNVVPFKYAGNYVYGYLTFPQRAIKADMTVPDGTNGTTVLADILALRQLLIDDRHFGPYMLYVNSQWSEVLDSDFSTAKGTNTLRQRILALPDIMDIRTLDRLPSTEWHMILVEMRQENVRAVVGMEVQTVQWESMGGMMRHFKVMCLQVPQLRADTAGNSGIAHGYSD